MVVQFWQSQEPTSASLPGDTRQSEGVQHPDALCPEGVQIVSCFCSCSKQSGFMFWHYDRTDKAVLAVNGFAADGNMFVKKVRQRLEVSVPLQFAPSLASFTKSQWYRHAHSKDMPLRAIARLIQTMLYARRFFPYYVYNILGGIEEDGYVTPI